MCITRGQGSCRQFLWQLNAYRSGEWLSEVPLRPCILCPPSQLHFLHSPHYALPPPASFRSQSCQDLSCLTQSSLPLTILESLSLVALTHILASCTYNEPTFDSALYTVSSKIPCCGLVERWPSQPLHCAPSCIQDADVNNKPVWAPLSRNKTADPNQVLSRFILYHYTLTEGKEATFTYQRSWGHSKSN